MVSLLTTFRSPAFYIAGTVAICCELEVLPIEAVRIGAVLALTLQIIYEQRAGSNQYLTAPLFILATISLIFFSAVFNVLETPIMRTGAHYLEQGGRVIVTASSIRLPLHTLETFYGSEAERVLVVFGLCCLAVHSVISEKGASPPESKNLLKEQAGEGFYLFAGAVLLLTMVNVANSISRKYGGPSSTEIQSLVPPLLSFSLVFLVYLAVPSTKWRVAIIAFLALIITMGLVYVGEAKKPVFIVFAALAYFLRRKNLSGKSMLIAAGVFVFAVVTVLQGVDLLRTQNRFQPDVKPVLASTWVESVMRAKIILRQAATKYCLQSVIQKHQNQTFSPTKQLFWLKGLVPRAIWPEKPSLSMGADYASIYCGDCDNAPPYCMKNLGNQHSASITLLGQPIIQGGKIGFLLHGGILIICLGVFGWVSRRDNHLATVVIVALLPWLIDFDQDLAMYVANAVKFFFAMTPLIFLAHRLQSGASQKNGGQG